MRMRKITEIYIAVLVSAALLIVPACAPKGTVPQAEQPKAKLETIEWKMPAYYPNTNYFIFDILQTFCDRVYKRTNGRLHITIYPGGELGFGPLEMLRRSKAGDFDIAEIWEGQCMMDLLPAALLDSPRLADSLDDAVLVPYSTYKKLVWPIIREKFNLQPLWRGPTMGPQRLFAKKPLVHKEDWKGLRMRSYGRSYSMLYEHLGATAVFLQWSDVYSAFQRGMIDGMQTSYSSACDIKAWEVVNYCTEDEIAYTWAGAGVNTNSLASLPKDIQEILIEVGREMEPYHLAATKKYDAIDRAKALNAGIKVAKMSDETWNDITAYSRGPLWDDVIQLCGSMGYGGIAQQFYAECRKALEK
jgi:TRAP-type C4-dicarboxylate transport system substrate-binding protein